MDDHLFDALREMLTGQGIDLGATFEALASSGVDLSQLSADQLLDLVHEHGGGGAISHHASQVYFGVGGYRGSYNGIDDCWYSNDGYIYAPGGKRVGAA